MAERPNYIYQGGNVMMHSPLNLTNSEMFGFFIKGDLKKLHQAVDATLNQVAAGRMQFVVLSPFVMLTFTRVNHASSANPIDRAKGWGEETDIVTWVAATQRGSSLAFSGNDSSAWLNKRPTSANSTDSPITVAPVPTANTGALSDEITIKPTATKLDLAILIIFNIRDPDTPTTAPLCFGLTRHNPIFIKSAPPSNVFDVDWQALLNPLRYLSKSSCSTCK